MFANKRTIILLLLRLNFNLTKVYFSDFGFDDELMDSLDAMHFEEATPIQSEAIPVIMDGHDLIACAQTGTGKTAAYLLPVINDILYTEGGNIDTVILVPTRELAIQIDQQMSLSLLILIFL